MDIRYFTYATHGDDLDIFEITERQFTELDGTISYERHTVWENGVSQVCLTVEPYDVIDADDLELEMVE